LKTKICAYSRGFQPSLLHHGGQSGGRESPYRLDRIERAAMLTRLHGELIAQAQANQVRVRVQWGSALTVAPTYGLSRQNAHIPSAVRVER
jgi:hypothetical protein